MKTKAAVAWQSGAPLSIETVDLEGPKFGEVLVEIKASGCRNAGVGGATSTDVIFTMTQMLSF